MNGDLAYSPSPSRSTKHAFSCFVAVAAIWAGPCGIASAYEDTITAGVETGYAQALSGGDIDGAGALFGLTGTLGLSDTLTLRGRLGAAHHPAGLDAQVGWAGAEVLYLFDVLRFVPFFGGGVAAMATLQGGSVGGDLAATGVFGGDYLLSRKTLVGLEVRAFVLPLSLDDRGLDPFYLTATARFEILIEWL